MKKSALSFLLFVTVAASAGAAEPSVVPNPWCEAAPGIREALDKAYEKNDGTLSSTQHSERRLSRLRALREERPDDLFVHLWYQSAWKDAPNADLGPLIAEYRSRQEQRPDDPVARYLLASVLIGKKTMEAMELLDQVLLQKPDLARAHLAHVKIAQMPAYRDKDKALAHLKTFMEMCPTTLDAFDFIRSVDDPAFLQANARKLRSMLRDRNDADSLGYYETLWNLEFRVTATTEHEQLRSRVAGDLKHLRRMKHAEDDSYLDTLDSGYQLTNDREGRRWVEERYVKVLPHSHATMMMVTRRFDSEHPYPGRGATVEEARRYRRELLSASDDWIRRWPDQPWVWSRRLGVVRELDDVTVDEAERTADGLLNALATNPGLISSMPPYAIQVAELYLKKSTRLERIPALVEQGLEEAERSTAAFLKSDWYPPDESNPFADNIGYARWQGWPILVQAYLKTSQPDKARETIARMWSALETSAQENQKADRQDRARALRLATCWESMGRLAEHENRKLDALVFYQTALGQSPGKQSKESLTGKTEQLWRSLGGTDEGLKAWSARGEATATVKESQEASAWEEKNKPLPDFTLGDLSGKIWRLSDLKGKVAFINIWATWCGPCVQELPHLAKLNEQLRDDPGVVVLSLNVDSELGLVGPFVKEHGINFPVIPALAYVQDLLPMMSIPRNWVVGPTGLLLSEQVGFGTDGEAWRKSAELMIDKAR